VQELISKITDAIKTGEEEQAKALVEEGLRENLGPEHILKDAMMPAMNDVGMLFSKGEVFIPELIVAAMAMEAGLEVLKPHLGDEAKGAGRVVLGTVYGDIHSIGKNLVRMCMEGAGFEVIDIGEDLRTEKFVDAYKEHSPDILGLSALLSSTMQRMPEVIEAVRAVDPGALIMVGGAPVTQEFADDVGASGYAPDAFKATLKANELLDLFRPGSGFRPGS
jgi:5-methyltetrahydrofolate--homocysteine methyltransferase